VDWRSLEFFGVVCDCNSTKEFSTSQVYEAFLIYRDLHITTQLSAYHR